MSSDVRIDPAVTGTGQPSAAVRPNTGGPSQPGRKSTLVRSAVETLRWAWRQLTSMRTALLLLFLLALAAIPGSIVPQSNTNPLNVSSFITRHPDLAPWYRRLGLFNVFGSAWFAAIYLLLMVSLVGCVLPRLRTHLTAIRAKPPKAPARLTRIATHRGWTSDTDTDTVLAAAAEAFAARHYRVRHGTDRDGRRWVAAERGRHRESGNLLFHFAVLVVLIGMAATSLLGFKGTVLVVVGDGFSNTVTQYDGYAAGRFFPESRLEPFTLKLKHFKVTFETKEPSQLGAARDFDATMQVTPEPGAKPVIEHLQVNHPLHLGNEDVHLVGHGYAPHVTVRDGKGNIAYSSAVPFLPQDGNFTSTGVVKVPDAVNAAGKPEQIGLQGLFLPTAVVTRTGGPVSTFPNALNPALYFTAYLGDLGLDTGTPQSVYSLDTTNMRQIMVKGQPFRVALQPGQTVKLPGGAGTVTLDGWQRWTDLQISARPGTYVVLAGAVLALLGLMGSLFIPRRRAWVRVDPAGKADGVESGGPRNLVTLAGLDQRASGGRGSEGLDADIDAVEAALHTDVDQPDPMPPVAGAESERPTLAGRREHDGVARDEETPQ
jgi:cytochrome c biogenesis protein